MSDALLLTFATIGLGAVFYSHLRLGDFVRGARRTMGLRLFLIGLGIVVGVALTAIPTPESRTLVFIMGFGLAHLPPALVLMLKRLRGERPS